MNVNDDRDPAGRIDNPDSAAVVELAASLLDESLATMTRRERRQQRRLATVVDDPALRELTFAMTDEVLRFTNDNRAARRLRSVVAEHGVPQSMNTVDRVALSIGSRVAPHLPHVIMPMVRSRLLREANGVVIAAGDPDFRHHLARRREQGFRLNVNVLGEAILSDAEAAVRVAMLLERIARADVNYVSLKISAICANLDAYAFEHSVDRICDRLRTLYRAAGRSVPATFVNLDMEEYRDLQLTIVSLQRVLDEDEFAGIDAGIVLQAYLPDAHDACAELCRWALARNRRAGGTLKIRVVKGANLAMERVDAELHGWQQAPYSSKAEVDASFKRLITAALDEQFSGAVRVGVASHNLFDLAWALSLKQGDRIDIEMLEGMAPAQSRAVLQRAGDVLLYAPVVRSDDLPASIAYLTRRLDENTSPDNFLRALFTLTVGSPEWNEQRARFEQALTAQQAVDTTSRRGQDRSVPRPIFNAVQHGGHSPFHNAADTDWTSSANRHWIADHLTRQELASYPTIESLEQIDAVVVTAVEAGRRWAATSFDHRRATLRAVADLMESRRGVTLALMARETAKTIAEGDPEVSEAVDFARYYARSTEAIEYRLASVDAAAQPRDAQAGHGFAPVGLVVVASPWNFPYAIPAGGVCAALAAGNAVVLKPAPEARAVAWLLATQLWEAGVPNDVLQFVACPDNEVGQRLITHERVATVVLTGAYETAQRFLDWKPSMRLLAETSGKNAMVITAAADEDAAIRDLVRSAFGHAGQKCSAASLAIIEGPLYDDQRFMHRLADAVRSVRVGAAADPATMMGPLIAPPTGNLLRALTSLDDGESWLVEPRQLGDDATIWNPGVRLGVAPGSWLRQTECFGPVLGLIRAADLSDAVAIQNAGDYGLTGGLQSLDEREIEEWLEHVEVGNAYVNRHMTGAIVQRQPFGGWKRSSVGCGPKAGGPSYVEAFGEWSGGNDADPEFASAWGDRFTTAQDRSHLASERNVLRFRPLTHVGLIIGDGAEHRDIERLRIAARTAGVTLTEIPAASIEMSADRMAAVDRAGGLDRVRLIGLVGDEVRRELHQRGIDVDATPACGYADVELRRWVREQAISWTRHRHGRLIDLPTSPY